MIPKYNPYEERILNVLIWSFRPLTTRQIASFAGISYNTTVVHLRNLNKKRKVNKKTRGNRIYWRIN